MRKILLFVFALIVYAACSFKGENTQKDKEGMDSILIGSWYQEFTQIDDKQPNFKWEIRHTTVFYADRSCKDIFRPKGTYMSFPKDFGDIVALGTWNLIDDNLTVTLDKNVENGDTIIREQKNEMNYQIMYICQDSLVFHHIDSDGYGVLYRDKNN